MSNILAGSGPHKGKEINSKHPVCQYQDHVYYQVQLLINEAQAMLDQVGRDKSTKLARTKLATAGRFLGRVIQLIPYFERQGRASLGEVSSCLQRAATLLNHTDITTLSHAKQLAEVVTAIHHEAIWKSSVVIKAEEDKMFPGCGRDEYANIIWHGVTLRPGMKVEGGQPYDEPLN